MQLTSKFAVDLEHDLLNGTLDLAFLTALPPTPLLSSVTVARQPMYVAMLESDDLAQCADVRDGQL